MAEGANLEEIIGQIVGLHPAEGAPGAVVDDAALAGRAPLLQKVEPHAPLVRPEESRGVDPMPRDLLLEHAAVRRIALGPRILRAETAAIAAISLWMAQQGDWVGGA